MNACRVKELYKKLLAKNIPILFESRDSQEEYLRFLAVSAELIPIFGSIYIPQKLQVGWNIHFLQHHNNYYDVLETLGLPDNQVKFLINGEVSFDFLDLYSKSFKKAILPIFYIPIYEKKMA